MRQPRTILRKMSLCCGLIDDVVEDEDVWNKVQENFNATVCTRDLDKLLAHVKSDQMLHENNHIKIQYYFVNQRVGIAQN